jgi:SpoVK/Ycf46/Vps4 family AAA+-type ATPase
LDRLLERAIDAAAAAHGAEAAGDHFRGLHIAAGEVERLLARPPGTPLLWIEHAGQGAEEAYANQASRLAWLAQAFDLSAFEMDAVLIALAPELDLRYERLYAFLQDDVTRKRATVDLVLNLLCPSAEARLAERARFSSEAPLIRHRLIRLIPDPHQVQPPLLAHYLKLDEQIVRLLLQQPGIDPRLQAFCELVEPVVDLNALALARNMKQALRGLVSHARKTREPLRLYFHGPAGVGKRRCAEALAGQVDAPLLIADLSRVVATETEFGETIRLIFREDWFQDAILYLDGLDALHGDARGMAFDCVLEALTESGVITILAGATPWQGSIHRPLEVITVSFRLPEFASRRIEWQASLEAKGVVADQRTLDALSDRFRLTPAQIAEAVSDACGHAQWRARSQPASATASRNRSVPAQGAKQGEAARHSAFVAPTTADLFAAARAQSGHELTALAHTIEPKYAWGDIVLPEDSLAQLREICQRVAHRHRVLGDWGFDRKLSLGKGTNALFAGPSGTGKTMAAEIIANALGLDLYRIDLAGVVSKYIGETEKNLDRVFGAAENANAILFFDEADALFGKRSEVRDSHDRFANIEISYLLQKMEEYDGVAILATNLRKNLDEAFMRRLAFTVQFPFPDEASRQRIWTGVWPAETPLDPDIDLDFLARQFKLSGGNIKNIALASAFLAAEDETPVTMAHLLQATRREHQKIGKTLSTAEFDALEQESQGVVRLAG